VSGDDVQVSRSTLRGMRSLVAGVVAGVLLLVGAVVMVTFESHKRCQAGNDFRRRDLPTAFDRYTRRLGDELEAPADRVAEVRERVAADLDELFPARDCRPW
jgi:hypothetical protein